MILRRHPLSLNARLLLAASLALAAFLGLTGLALDKAFRDSARAGLRERLQTHIYSLLAAAELGQRGRLKLPERMPEPRFARPDSGLYAAIEGKRFTWQSPSALGLELSFGGALAPGATRFRGPLASPAGDLLVLRQGVAWEGEDGGLHRYTVSVAEDLTGFRAEVSELRRSLLFWLGGAGLVLVALQGSILRWSLRPLRRVANDLGAIEAGERERLTGRYPRELEGLTRNLNGLLDSEREHLSRYRNTLDDLAHSLKTPLAVARSSLESDSDVAQMRETVLTQVGRMNDIIGYQLQRAARSGHRTLAAPVAVAPVVDKIAGALTRVYADKAVAVQTDIQEEARFFGDENDLMEMLGNVLDNAFKWCGSRVRVSAQATDADRAARAGLELVVEDDGPGVDETQLERLVQRGVRGDERVSGQGIGLAVVREIVDAYHGRLRVGAGQWGGARIELQFPSREAGMLA